MPKPSRGLIVAAFAAVYLVWGSTFLGMRFAIESIPPFSMAGGRYFLAGLLLYTVTRRLGAPRPTWAEWQGAVLVGGALLLCGNGAATFSVKYIPSSLTALLVATVPMFMAVFGWWGRFSPRPSGPVWFGLAIGFAGVFLLVRPPGESAGHFSTGQGIGMAAALIGSAIWAAGSLYSKKARTPASPALMVGMQMLCGGALLLIAGGIFGEWHRFDPAAMTTRSLWAFAYLVTFGSAIGFTAYVWLLRVCDPAKVATYAFINPIVAVLLGWGLGGEKVGIRTLEAAALIVVAVAIIITSQSRKAGTLAPVVE